jgi:hypothetical protein
MSGILEVLLSNILFTQSLSGLVAGIVVGSDCIGNSS